MLHGIICVGHEHIDLAKHGYLLRVNLQRWNQIMEYNLYYQQNTSVNLALARDAGEASDTSGSPAACIELQTDCKIRKY